MLRNMAGALCLAAALTIQGGGCRADEPRATTTTATVQAATTEPPRVARVPIPDEVRGLYWTADTAGSARADELLAYMEKSGINAVVIDLKMDDGELGFLPQDASLQRYAMDPPAIRDLDGLLKKLAERNMYRIARLPVMRDPAFATHRPDLALKTAGGAVWRDKIGARWVDPAAPEVADYAIALAREAHARGFDEIQFDYVRYPSDGIISAIIYPVSTSTKIAHMRAFFDRLGSLRDEGISVSYDLFGMPFLLAHDFNIGQRLVDVFPVADFISPMTYPSHYAAGFEGFENPALYPYEVVKKTLDTGAEQLVRELGVATTSSRPKFRPWLQDFDIGAEYTSARIEAQLKAARDAGASGWMLWNARNVYEPANYTP